MKDSNITHLQRAPDFALAKQSLIDKAEERGDLPYASLDEQLKLIDELAGFELGRFLIQHGGLNGYWIQYIIDNEESSNPLERYLLKEAPICRATKERFRRFKDVIQSKLKEGCSLLSIPCGIMSELLEIDYRNLRHFTLNGYDIDPEALTFAEKQAEKRGLSAHCSFARKEAWSIDDESAFDLISSNGLTIYETDDRKVAALYRLFHRALKPGGSLVTSFIVKPALPPSTPIDPRLIKQKVILSDILEVKWNAYRTEEQVLSQLQKAGFSEASFLYDSMRLFPTVVANK